jgi:hypothetical protein
MKYIWVTLIVPVLCLFFVVEWIPAKRQAEQHRRAELHMLEIIRSDVANALEAGHELPKNWAALTNSVHGDLILGISQYNSIPPSTELYTVLPHPVRFTNYYPNPGLIFLVRSKPVAWPGKSSGRWMLLAQTNFVHRFWIAEDQLPPELKAQLTNSQR